MKITWFQLFVLIGVVITSLFVVKCNDNVKEETIPKSTYDSIMQVVKTQDAMLDSFRLEIKKTDTIIVKTKEYIYVKGKNTLALNSNQSIRVFNEWTRFMHDSLTRLGYFRPMSDTFNQVR